MSKLADRFWDLVAIALILFAVWGALHTPARGASVNSFVQMIERREGVWPGKTTVWPDCNCSVRYVGTTVHGNRYTIVIDKLD
jgi:hypothetical protein